jgi:nucleotide-binding universal stress UspA family protein
VVGAPERADGAIDLRRQPMIVICFDGSKDARAAIERAGELYPSQPATVVTVWEPMMEVWARATPGFGLVPSVPNAEELDQETRKAADETASEGVKLAAERGLEAKPLVVTQQTTPAQAILAAADELDASVIVVGTRGLRGVKSVLLGSVSNELVHHADRSVTVVPSAELAELRAKALLNEPD